MCFKTMTQLARCHEVCVCYFLHFGHVAFGVSMDLRGTRYRCSVPLMNFSWMTDAMIALNDARTYRKSVDDVSRLTIMVSSDK